MAPQNGPWSNKTLLEKCYVQHLTQRVSYPELENRINLMLMSRVRGQHRYCRTLLQNISGFREGSNGQWLVMLPYVRSIRSAYECREPLFCVEPMEAVDTPPILGPTCLRAGHSDSSLIIPWVNRESVCISYCNCVA